MNKPPAEWRGAGRRLALQQLTSARVGLTRVGTALSTADHLRFQHDHARARDAVHLEFDAAAVRQQLQALGLQAVTVHSHAADRAHYLRNPDAGRRLASSDAAHLDSLRSAAGCDLALVLADGLSSAAMHTQPLPFLQQFLPLAQARGWQLGPTVVVTQGRVAIGDDIGQRLGAATVVVLIGERPGLSAADSMGIYLTHAPQPGCTDAQRNCISNIRPGGLDYAGAAATLVYLLDGARRLGRSGVDLKDDSWTVTATHDPHALAAHANTDRPQ